jgi:hypothetical protein
VLFAVLPIGSRSYHEMGIKPPGGGDPGAPVNPNLKRKFITTTWDRPSCSFTSSYGDPLPPDHPAACVRTYA